ncbi:uncharacterized protein [Typha latifolia]|uniref:uncharacterized protein isoform X2 n=1 Tax=Typha latifolia TaxID=4733 RepID=UPI003C2EDC3C
MEESARREERFIGLRTEASAASRITATPHMPFPSPNPPLPEQLPNPMFPAAPAGEMSPRTPRFDNYMNPAAALSGYKRKSEYYSPSSSIPTQFTRAYGPRSHYEVPSHPPAQQFNTAWLPDNNIPFPMLPQAPQNSPWRSPVQFQSPFPGQQGTYSSAPGPWNASVQFQSPFSDHQGTYSRGPGPWNASTGSLMHGFYPNSSRGGFTSPRYGRGSPMGNPGIRGSPHSYSGRGKGRQYSSSTNTRGRGGRGQSFNNHSGLEEPEHYYSKAMVEDPWRELKPVVGDILKPRNISTSWLPESLTDSKGISNQSSLKLDSELSLAEYLDISFKETIDET